MTEKYIIVDATANTGKNFIGDNNDNVTLDNARIFDTEKEAQELASSIDSGDEWAEVVPLSCFK